MGSQAVTDTKLEELTREVREHNNFARRVPTLEEQMKVVNHRLAVGMGMKIKIEVVPVSAK